MNDVSEAQPQPPVKAPWYDHWAVQAIYAGLIARYFGLIGAGVALALYFVSRKKVGGLAALVLGAVGGVAASLSVALLAAG